MLPGRRGRDRGDEARGGGRGAARADARVPPLPRRLGGSWWSASSPSAATSTARRRCRADLRRVAVEAAVAVYDPERLGVAIGDLLTRAARKSTSPTSARPSPCSARLRVLRDALERRAELRLRRGVRQRGPADPGGDDLRPARALPKGEVTWEQEETFGPIRVAREAVARVTDLAAHRRSAALPLAASRSASPTWRRRRRRPRARSRRRSSC